MSEKDDYYSTRLNQIDQHIEAAERLLDKSLEHDCGHRALINAMLAGVLAVMELGKVMAEIRDEISIIELKMK